MDITYSVRYKDASPFRRKRDLGQGHRNKPGRTLIAPPSATNKRAKLSRSAILQGGLSLADTQGIEALSMRTLAKTLGFGVMSLYNHVTDKDDLIDGMLELVAAEIELPPAQAPWKAGLKDCAISAYKALLNHPWAGRYWSRGPGPNKNTYHEAVLRVMREGGFSEELACQGYHAVTMHVVGFAVQVTELPYNNNAQLVEMTKAAQQQMPQDEFPYLNEHIQFHLAGKDKTNNFKYMLDLILNGLERELEQQAS